MYTHGLPGTISRAEMSAMCSSSSRSLPANRAHACQAKKPRTPDTPLEQRKPLFQKFSSSEEDSIIYRSVDDTPDWDRREFSRVYDEGDNSALGAAQATDLQLPALDSFPDVERGDEAADAVLATTGQLNLRGFADGDVPDQDAGGLGGARASVLHAQGQARIDKRPYAGWYLQPGLTVRALHDLMLQNCERGEISLGPLYTVFDLATTPDEARMALSALSTTRLAIVQQRMALRPFSPSFTGKFVKMCVRCGGVQVLLEAMRRCNDLGLDFSLRALHFAMKHYATNLELEPLEAIFRAMPDAGLYPTTYSRSCLVRAFLNADQLERAQDLLDEFQATRGRVLSSTLNLMAYARRRRSARAILNQ